MLLTAPVPAKTVPPIVNFSANVTSGTTPLPVLFTDQSLYATGWAWYFGDETYTAPWTQVSASSGWSARSGQSSVVLPGGSIMLMGGIEPYPPYYRKNDTWQSTDNGTTWTLVNASSGWLGRYQHTSVALPDRSIVLMGGWDGSSYFNDTWRSTDNGATWMLMNASSVWPARYGLTSVALPDNSIVLMGGSDGTQFYNDVWQSTDTGATWTQINASAGWTGRHSHTSVALPDGTTIVLMGGIGESYVVDNDVWRSTDKGVMWTEMNWSAEWVARYEHTSVALPDGSIVLMGGDDVWGNDNEVWRSMDEGVTWTQVNASPGWMARRLHTSVALPDGSIVLMGGYTDVFGGMNDTWRFMPAGSSAQNPSHTYTRPGTYTVSLQAYNTVGYNNTRKAGYITVFAHPNVTAISPTSGPTAGGTRVIVTGNGFTGATAVRFGTTAGTHLTVNSSTRITITSPAHAAGPVNVMVTTPGGTSAVSTADRFTYA